MHVTCKYDVQYYLVVPMVFLSVFVVRACAIAPEMGNCRHSFLDVFLFAVIILNMCVDADTPV